MSDVNTDERLRAVEQHLFTHEAVCAERYGQIKADFASLNSIVRYVGYALLGGMATILAKLVFPT
jgi:hypothetical protein